jgi:hypothetical protein
MERPYRLGGKTYKVRAPHIEGAIYITINNDEKGNPVELFANTRNAESVAWLTAVTRLATMVLSNGGDAKAVARELKSVFDPRGGYYGNGGHLTLSVVAEVGSLLERHIGDSNE